MLHIPYLWTYCSLCLENPSLAFTAPCLPLIQLSCHRLSKIFAEYPGGITCALPSSSVCLPLCPSTILRSTRSSLSMLLNRDHLFFVFVFYSKHIHPTGARHVANTYLGLTLEEALEVHFKCHLIIRTAPQGRQRCPIFQEGQLRLG